MTSSSIAFKVGTRGSKLALIQAEAAFERLREMVPCCRFDLREFSSPGDRDRETDLRATPSDFFTLELDRAVKAGEIDLAIHSAKDVPPDLDEALDWVWLPWAADARDAWVLAPGRRLSDLGSAPRIGVSSERREQFAAACFPGAELATIRGNIEDRLAQLDRGAFDAVIMASAALLRLGIENRISEWIPLEVLPTPEGQGRLCIVFRDRDARAVRLRSLLIKTAVFVGGGVGSGDLCTIAGVEALKHCDTCLYDALLDQTLLNHMPAGSRCFGVGKRAGAHSVPQQQTTRMLVDEIRKGRRVVRLKGGDSTLFGRLAEETEACDRLGLPYRVVPGVNSLSVASASTGILLSRRDVSRGLCVMTARTQGGAIADVSGSARGKLPCTFFMCLGVMKDVANQLMADGLTPETPAAVVFDAGSDGEDVVRAPLREIGAQATAFAHQQAFSPAAILIVGAVAAYAFSRNHGALQGQRVLLTCSGSLLSRASAAVRDLGGRPVAFPMVELKPSDEAPGLVARAHTYDWIALTSPSAVACFFDVFGGAGGDLRKLPRVMVSGPATARALEHHGIRADLCPSHDFGAAGLAEQAATVLSADSKVLRLRSDKAGNQLAAGLRVTGATVDDAILYINRWVEYNTLPSFDAALFASTSAVTAYAERWGVDPLAGKLVAGIGPPTVDALTAVGIPKPVMPKDATIAMAVLAMACRHVAKTLEEKS